MGAAATVHVEPWIRQGYTFQQRQPQLSSLPPASTYSSECPQHVQCAVSWSLASHRHTLVFTGTRLYNPRAKRLATGTCEEASPAGQCGAPGGKGHAGRRQRPGAVQPHVDRAVPPAESPHIARHPPRYCPAAARPDTRCTACWVRADHAVAPKMCTGLRLHLWDGKRVWRQGGARTRPAYSISVQILQRFGQLDCAAEDAEMMLQSWPLTAVCGLLRHLASCSTPTVSE